MKGAEITQIVVPEYKKINLDLRAATKESPEVKFKEHEKILRTKMKTRQTYRMCGRQLRGKGIDSVKGLHVAEWFKYAHQALTSRNGRKRKLNLKRKGRRKEIVRIRIKISKTDNRKATVNQIKL